MILKKNKTKLSTLASRLLEKEVIFKEDLVKILGDRPYNNQEIKD
jgi:cell division protease FtsH